ncbi:MAG: hypothetical protein K2P68_06000 [Sphingomonas sp.]|nr:hypothetical protein [Sphingomonas sp.]
MRPIFLLSLGLLAPLTACDGSKEGTSISINSADEDGNVVAGVDGKTGRVSVDTPVFKGSLTLPKLHLDADNFDLNGVHLYPGSTISTMNIDAHKKGEDNDDDGALVMTFDSPADPATVRDWFKTRLSAAGFTLTDAGNGLTGTTDEKKPFKLDLVPAAGGHAKGTIAING